MSELRCNFCGSGLRDVVVDLGDTPLSNALVDAAHLGHPDPVYPLRAFVCRECWLVQVPPVQSPERIFGDYVYFSSYSTTWLEHVRRFAETARASFALSGQSLVVEIASNDGHLAALFRRCAYPRAGRGARGQRRSRSGRSGHPDRGGVLRRRDRDRVGQKGLHADLLIGNNVLAHVPDLNDFVEGMRVLLKPAGTISLEFPHLLRMIEGGEFDTIYHEHFSYFSLGTVQRVLAAHGLEIVDVEELPTHGGSLRVYAAHRGNRPIGAQPAALIARERAAGLETLGAYATMAPKAARTKAVPARLFRRRAP